MAFLRSLFSGVSGLRNHQTMMDVIGNNIANINTTAFKAGRATFSEMFAQTLRGAGSPIGTNGGTNPMQVGLGMSVNTIDTLFTQGNIETTGNPTDLAIQGPAFFVVNKGGQTVYTRDGTFTLDATGKLVSPGTGAVLQGKMADAAGVIPSGTTLDDITIDRSLKSPAKATATLKFAGNLDASALVYNAGPPATGGISTSSVPVFDSLGNQISLTLTYTKTGPNAWNWNASVPDPVVAVPPNPAINVGTGTLAFNSDGSLQAMTGSPITITPTSGASALSVAIEFGTPTAAAPGVFTGVTQNSSASIVTAGEPDGYTSGTLNNITVDTGGKVIGTFTNGQVQTLAQIMLADFNNPSGLVRIGDNAYSVTANSGAPTIVDAGGTSTIMSGSLEQSNVDLAQEFTKMITAQRGFQANARVITTSDQILAEVVALKQ